MITESESGGSKRAGMLRLFGVLIVIGLLAGLGYHWYLRTVPELSPAMIRSYLQSFGHWAVIVYIILYIVNTITILPPITPLALASGWAFGAVWGGVYLYIAMIIGTSITFWLSRTIGRRFAERMIRGKMPEFEEKIKRHGFGAILFLRLVPVLPSDIINYAAGLTQISFRDYFWGTFLGIIPGIVVNSLLGGGIGDIQKWSDIWSTKFFWAILIGLISIVFPILYYVIKGRQTKTDLLSGNK